MLESINILQWLKLLGGIFIFLGPGFCIITILHNDSLKCLTHWFVLSLTLSVSLWVILLAWLKLANIRINLPFVLVLCSVGWLTGLIYLARNTGRTRLRRLSINMNELLLWAISAASGLIILWALRYQVAGMGSDSYHHTLIAQLIHDNGGLPNDYQPATEKLISFSYHYGYHAVMASLMWLSGWGSRVLVLVSGALLVMLSTLSIGLLTEELTEKPLAGIIAAAFTGLVFVFPIHLLNWGRYSQLAALALLAVFLQMVVAYYKYHHPSMDFRKIVLLALVATGVAITHYRVTIMAGIAVVFLILLIKEKKYSFQKNYNFLITLLVIAGLALFFFSPWLLRVVQSHQAGYSIKLADINSSYYSIYRFDSNVLKYPTNILVLAITLPGLLWGIVKKQWYIIWIAIWIGAMLLLSGPKMLAGSMDRITVVVSLYLPVAVIAGWFIQEIYSHLRKPYYTVVTALLLITFIWSAIVAINKNLKGPGFVTPQDLAAAEWIKINTPADAYFAENTFKFGFSSNFVIGIDAGYWLPILADRQTVTLPMIFDIEMFQQVDGLQQLLDLYNLGTDLTTQKAIDYFQREKISYLYIGEKGGQINVDLLVKSNNFSLVYQKDKVYVFKVITK